MHASLVTLCLLAALAVVGESYLLYADRIPNGRFVPHPCKPNELWKGVGHFNVDGGGHRNPFGMDFKTAGLNWTRELCLKDSDGDGRTNGEELGDPDCVWEPDALPARTKQITHPGICDDHDSLECKRKTFHRVLYRNQEEWMADACKRNEFVCEGLDSPDVKNQTIRFPRTYVPAQETTYMCLMFDFQEPTEDVHLIATTPILDNREVMHHMALFGCKGEPDIGLWDGNPYQCGMIPHRDCNNIIAIWALGMNGECFANNTGIRMGLAGYKRIAIQMHWNNPEKISNYTDRSGMTLYYTRNRRPNDMGVFTIGSDLFFIPPRRKWVEVNSTCSSACTKKKFSQPAYITSAFNHMHYLGFSQTIEHIRDGKTLDHITNDAIYSYDSPKVHRFANPIEIRPGDELRTRCHFNSMSRTTTTQFGDSTRQEMCFGFVSYYPASALSSKFCLSEGTVLSCDPSTFRGCDEQKFLRHLEEYLKAAIKGNCSFHGPCFEECKALILETRRNEPCMRHKDYWERIKKWRLGYGDENIQLLGRLASCEAEIARDEALASMPGPTKGPSSKAAPAAERGLAVALLAFLLVIIF